MSEISDRLLLKLEGLLGILPEKAVAEVVSRRVAEWLTSDQPEPTCPVRAAGTLVVASRQESVLHLIVTKPSFQIDDSDLSLLGGESRGGPSIIDPGTPVTVVQIPLSDLFGDSHD